MSDRASDQLLVDRVKAGEKHAFDLLVLKYQHVKRPRIALLYPGNELLVGLPGSHVFYTPLIRDITALIVQACADTGM